MLQKISLYDYFIQQPKLPCKGKMIELIEKFKKIKMIEVKQIKLNKGSAIGIKIMKDEKSPFVVLIKAEKGFVVCSNFDMKALEKKGIAAGRVQGINSIETALETNVVEVTSKAKELGIKEGMPVKEVLERLC